VPVVVGRASPWGGAQKAGVGLVESALAQVRVPRPLPTERPAPLAPLTRCEECEYEREGSVVRWPWRGLGGGAARSQGGEGRVGRRGVRDGHEVWVEA